MGGVGRGLERVALACQALQLLRGDGALLGQRSEPLVLGLGQLVLALRCAATGQPSAARAASASVVVELHQGRAGLDLVALL